MIKLCIWLFISIEHFQQEGMVHLMDLGYAQLVENVPLNDDDLVTVLPRSFD